MAVRTGLILALAGWLAACAAGGAEAARAERAAPVKAPAEAPGDKPLDAWRLELLDVAFETASAIPLKPFIKVRARALEQVVETCLELDQPRRALRYVEQMPNWRKGAGYADYAYYCARHGHAGQVQRYLDKAEAVARRPEQAWRQDRIKTKVARTYAWLGRTDEAQRLSKGVEASQTGRVEEVRARRADDKAAEQLIAVLAGRIEAKDFDLRMKALEALTVLYDRFYENADRRGRIEKTIRDGWDKMPGDFRIDLLLKLADAAAGHKDADGALKLVNEARVMADHTVWNMETEVPLRARLAVAYDKAGAEAEARTQAGKAMEVYQARKAKTIDMFRAEALRPLAEAHCEMGDAEGARKLYKLIVEEGMVNPSPRARAVDLVATCCSMARCGTKPGDALAGRIREISKALVNGRW